MAPKKRKDIGDGDDVPVTTPAASTTGGTAQGPSQPRGAHLNPATADSEPEAQPPEQEGSEPDTDTVRNNKNPERGDSVMSGSQAGGIPQDDDLHDMSVEELELEFQRLTRQNRLDAIRQAVLKKKRQNIQVPQVPTFQPRFPSQAPEVPTLQSRFPSQVPQATNDNSAVPELEHESVLRERQNERLRRAGLLPPRESEPRQFRASVPAPTIRQGTPMTPILHGVDRKLTEIMNAVVRPGMVVPGEKSELSRAGIKMTAPEKWKGDRSLHGFTEWVHSVAHYFKVHAPLSELLKVDLLGGYLAGDPLDWYWRYVAPVAQQWTASDVIVGLRRHFLVDELTRQAADRFEAAEQGSKDIHAFQAYLLKLADQMAEYPSPIALNRRLLKGMNRSLSSAIVATRGIDAELSHWDDIVQAAMDQERANRYASALSKSGPARADDRRDDRRDHRSARPNQPSRAPPGPGAPKARDSATLQRPSVQATRPTSSPHIRNTAPPGTRPVGPKPTDQCRTCKAFGHWSTDCPSRLRTHMLSVDEDGQADISALPYEEEDDDDAFFEANVFVLENEGPSDEMIDHNEDGWDESDVVGPMGDSGTSAPEGDLEATSQEYNHEEPDFRCNAVILGPVTRESNVSSAKAAPGRSNQVQGTHQPQRPPLVKPIAVYIDINGHKAKALFDSGSTADLISASFVDAHRINSFKLSEPSPLQLAITGSRGKINRACVAKVTHGPCDGKDRYFDILNIDRYDVILGTSYMKEFGVLLDVATHDVAYKGQPTAGLFEARKVPVSADTPVVVKKVPLSAFGLSHSKLPHFKKLGFLSSKVPATVKHHQLQSDTKGVKVEQSVEVEVSQDGLDTPTQPTNSVEEAIIERLRQQWILKTKDLWGPRPLKLPPFREINHSIPLIDEEYRPYCRPAKCPEQYREAYLEKINSYTKAGWWERASVAAAMPMMVIPKKDGRIRTVVDARQRNDNTVKDVTPFPDQDVIRRDVSRAKYRSKLDQADFFEQIRVVPEDVWKTAFATPFGTFLSQVAQQGDCNVPSTAQQLMMYLFREIIGRFAHVYLDDIFVFSNSIEEHEEHLRTVFDILRKAQLYLSKDKIDLYSKSMVCLGHVIDDQGLHADEDKLSKIMAWKEMSTVKEVQRFLGLVQYLAQFFPNLSTMTGPISKLTQKGQPFIWGPLQSQSLALLQQVAAHAPILKPIDPNHNKDPIFVVTDASTSGIGALYGQGKTWQSMRPAGFHSRKFNSAQMNYRTHEQELLAVLEALVKWEDQLLGRPFTIITDHRSLEYLQTQRTLSPRQTRWLEYLSRFDYKIHYVAGETNVVADYLSRFWEDPTVPSEPHDYVNADARLDDDGTDDQQNLYVAAIRRNTGRPRALSRTKPSVIDGKKTAIDTSHLRTDLSPVIQAGYASDPFFRHIWAKPDDHTVHFELSDSFLWKKLDDGSRVVCIPGVLFEGRRVTELLIDSTHKGLGHLGSLKTLAELRRYYFWPRMVKEVEAFCRTCGTCAVTKSSPTSPPGKLHPIPVPQRPWEGMAIDFVGPLPRTKEGFDFLLVVICLFSSMVHLVPTRTTVTALESARLIYDGVYRLHGLPTSIISDQDARWKSTFWQELHRLQGTKLRISTAYHPETDGATERANRTAIQILRSMVQADQKDWADRLTATEFAMNSQTNQTTGFSPFEMLYGFNPVMIHNPASSRWVSSFKGVRQYHEQIQMNMMAAHDNIIAARTRQVTQSNRHRAVTPSYSVGDLVYLSTKNLKLPSGRATKLLPRYLGPFKVTRCFTEVDSFTLELPEVLTQRRVHPTFHSSLLKPHEPNDDKLFPGRDPRSFYDFGSNEDEEWKVDDILSHRWLSAKLQLLVLWSTGESTWEPLENCDRLEVLDKYLELHGVHTPDMLPQGTQASQLVRS